MQNVFFSPVSASADVFSDRVELYAVNDLTAAQSVLLEWTLCDVDGGTVLSGTKTAQLVPCEAACLETVYTKNIFKQRHASRYVLMYKLFSEKGVLYTSGFRLFCEPKKVLLKKPAFEIASHLIEKNMCVLTIAASQLALYVHIDSKYDFTASDNFFPLAKNEMRTLTIVFNETVPSEAVKSFMVKSLFDLR